MEAPLQRERRAHMGLGLSSFPPTHMQFASIWIFLWCDSARKGNFCSGVCHGMSGRYAHDAAEHHFCTLWVTRIFVVKIWLRRAPVCKWSSTIWACRKLSTLSYCHRQSTCMLLNISLSGPSGLSVGNLKLNNSQRHASTLFTSFVLSHASVVSVFLFLSVCLSFCSSSLFASLLYFGQPV